MKVLITGMSGMLGSDLAQVFENKCQVFGIGRALSSRRKPFREERSDVAIPIKSSLIGGSPRRPTGSSRNGFRRDDNYFTCDLLNATRLEAIIKKIRPHVVIHSQAMTRVDDCELKPLIAYQNNVLTTQILVRVLKKYPARLIYISSDYVFDGKKKSAYLESDMPSPISVYGTTKWLGEEIIKNSGLNWVIVRTSWLYGQAGPNFVATILRLARDQKELKVVDDQWGGPTYTKDLALAIKAIVDHSKVRGIFNVTNSGRTHWNGFAQEILKRSGDGRLKVRRIKTKDFHRPAPRPANSVLSASKFKSTFGYTLRPWNEALGEFLRGDNGK